MDNVFEIMEARHSVRRYTSRPIEAEKAEILHAEIVKINDESGLHFELHTENTEVFKADKPSYGMFSGCRNFFLLYGPKNEESRVGYYGERLVLLAQSLGLNTCWVAVTFERSKVPTSAPAGMKLHDAIALGYGETNGVPHRSKELKKLSNISDDSPEWFVRGVKAAALAPTGLNGQRFYIEYMGGNRVKIKSLIGPCSDTDIGIVRYHFEVGAGKENFELV